MHARQDGRTSQDLIKRTGGTSLLLAWLAACSTAPAVTDAFIEEAPIVPSAPSTRTRAPQLDGPTRLGRLELAEQLETSGLAVSQADNNHLWAINDSGNDPVIYAMDTSGKALAQLPIEASNRDWEDLDSAFINGVETLIIADTGDNLRRNAWARLWMVTPSPSDALSPSSPRELRFSYEDGPRDVESVAVAGDALWLISKEAPAAGTPQAGHVYELPLSVIRDAMTTAPAELPIARYAGVVWKPRPSLTARLALSFANVDLDQATALDIDETRGVAWLLTYLDVRRFDRQGAEPWSRTLSREPAARYSHGLQQAEALAVSNDGVVVYTSEGKFAPIDGLPPFFR